MTVNYAAALQAAHQAMNAGRLDEADAMIAELAGVYAGEFNLLQLTGLLRFAQARVEDGVAALTAAHRVDPGREWVPALLVESLSKIGQPARALALGLGVLDEHPHFHDLRRRLAALCTATGDFERIAVLVAGGPPGDPFLAYCLSNPVLRVGEWSQGWSLYEHRWAAMGSQRPGPEWNGKLNPEGTLVLYDEQGMGDAVQFARFAPAVRHLFGGRVVLRVLKPLVPVMGGLADGVFDREASSQEMTRGAGAGGMAVFPLMSLPHLLDQLGEGFGLSGAPYLQAPAEAVARARQVLGPHRGRPRVGLAWTGLSHKVPFEAVRPLVDAVEVDWVNLQYGSPVRHPNLADPMAECGGHMGEIAGLIAALDLVITVDTSIAHLGGALGAPTWVMLDKVCCWRWGDTSERTAWYDSVRLYRQDVEGVWAPVTAALRRDLAHFALNR